MTQSGVMIGENLFAMLQDLRPSASVASSTPDQRNSVGVEYLRRVPDGQSVDVDEVCGPTGNSSPKLRLKLHRLWGAKAAPRAMEESSCGSPVVSADVEERHRRRAFAHYDCQSLTANLGYAAKLRGILLARRRNTATGASAASSFRASTPDETPEEDAGDGRGGCDRRLFPSLIIILQSNKSDKSNFESKILHILTHYFTYFYNYIYIYR